ncbi:MAG: lipid kinase, partial [Leptolyngbya sp. SIO4C1]|nr:lipid kinase [Leptolyngbya sp. SIO4C1]
SMPVRPRRLQSQCQIIERGHTRVIDAAYCNQRPMVLLAGIGFEADVVEQASREAKNRLGMLAYVLSGIRQLRDMEQFEATLETDSQVVSVSASAITVANLAPATSILAQGPAKIVEDDGLMDITIAAPSGFASAVAASYELFKSALSGSAAEREDIGFLQAKSVKISAEPPQKVALDGEIIGTTPVEITCVPQGLTLFVPTEAAEPLEAEKLTGLPKLKIKDKPVDDRPDTSN